MKKISVGLLGKLTHKNINIDFVIENGHHLNPSIIGQTLLSKQRRIYNFSFLRYQYVASSSWFLHSQVLFWTEYNSRSDDLSSDTFKYYPKLRVLKLSKDVLVKFPSDIFSPLTKLTDLDLSENSLTQIPCNLPSSLVNLNLNENPISDETGCGRDCLSPPDSLENLSLHNSNKGVFRRKKFPRFCESVPSIKYLDISASSLDSISSEDVAPLCGLQRINLTSVTVSHSNGTCQKLQFEKWLGDRKIEMIGSITAAKRK